MKDSRQLLNEIECASSDPSHLHIWWLGQMGYVLKSGTATLCIDLFLSEHPRRAVPPLLKPDQITNATLFLGTHDHKDHIDREVWPAFADASPSASFIVPSAIRDSIVDEIPITTNRVVGINDGEKIRLAGVEIEGVASAHEFLDKDEQTGFYPYMGFVIRINGFCIYHPGDTCIYEGLVSKLMTEKPDLMFVPINGRDAQRYANGYLGNMTFQEAVDFVGAVQPRLAIPGHYDMFTHNGEDPKKFADYMKVKYPTQDFFVCTPGKVLIMDRL